MRCWQSSSARRRGAPVKSRNPASAAPASVTFPAPKILDCNFVCIRFSSVFELRPKSRVEANVAPSITSRHTGSSAMMPGNSCSRKCRKERSRRSRLDLQVGIKLHMIFFKAFANAGERVVHVVGKLQHLVLILIDHAPAHHGLKVQNFVPIFSPVN